MLIAGKPEELQAIGIEQSASAVELHLPFPPSANRLWRRSGATIHKSSKYSKWLRDAGLIAISQRPPGIVGSYKISIQATRPDKRRRDLDNILKPISDLLMSVGVIGDDSDCEMISARWVSQGEGVSVRVERTVIG